MTVSDQEEGGPQVGRQEEGGYGHQGPDHPQDQVCGGRGHQPPDLPRDRHLQLIDIGLSIDIISCQAGVLVLWSLKVSRLKEKEKTKSLKSCEKDD